MFNKSIISLGFYAVLKIIIGFLLSKLIVLNFGSFGLAIYSQFQGLLILVMQFSSVGASSGIIKLASNDYSETGRKTFLSASPILLFGGIISILFFILSVVFEEHIRVQLLQGSISLIEYYSLICFILFFHTVSYWNSVRIGFREGTEVSRNGFWVALIGLALVFIFKKSLVVFLFAALLYYMGQVISSMVFDTRFYLSLKTNRLSIAGIKETYKKIVPFLIMALFTGIGQPLVNIFLRNDVALSFGSEFMGQWQGLVRISDAISQVISVLLTYFLLPRLSADKVDAELYRTLVSFFKMILPILIPGLFIIWLFSNFILKVLYDESFLSMGSLIHFQLMGDLMRVLNYTVAQVIISKAHWRLSILADITISLLLLVCYFLLKESLGFKVVVISYFIAHCGYAIFLYYSVFCKLKISYANNS